MVLELPKTSSHLTRLAAVEKNQTFNGEGI